MPTAEQSLHRVERPLYDFAESDRLAGLTRGTARRWLAGYQYEGRGHEVVTKPPVVALRSGARAEAVAFVDLVELVAIGRLRQLRFSLPQIREIVRTCETLLGVKHPLASLPFKFGGREIFVPDGDRLIEVGRRKGRQAWDEVLEPFLQTLDYGEQLKLAVRWWPLGKGRPIVVDPEYGFGLPVIAESGVRTEIVLERLQAGDLPEQIASDFSLRAIDVAHALQFETALLAA